MKISLREPCLKLEIVLAIPTGQGLISSQHLGSCRLSTVPFGWSECIPAQQTQNICITFIQRRPNVFDVGPTLYKCYANVLCLLGDYM